MRERTESAWAAVLLALTAIGFVLFCRWLSWPVVDDAGVSLSFGRTLFEGGGLRVTRGSQIVEGFSSPLWMIVQGVGTVLPFDGAAWSKWGGVACAAAGLVVVAFWASAGMGRALRLEDALVPAVAALNPSFAAWASSGMEVGLWTLAVAIAGVVVLRAMRTGQPFHAGVVLGALMLVRPEAPVLILGVGPAWLVVAWSRRRVLRELGLFALGVAIVVVVLLAARWWFFADVLPNTFPARRSWHLDGAQYVRGFVQTYELAVWAAAAGLFVAALWMRFKVPHVWLAAIWALCLLGFALNGDRMAEWRFGVPVLPLLGVVAMAGIDAARAARSSTSAPIRRLALIAGACIVLMTGIAVEDASARRLQVKENLQFGFEEARSSARALRDELEALGQRRPLVVLPAVGGEAWELRDAEIIDPTGVCDRVTARASPAAVDDYLSLEGPPAVMDVQGPGRYLAALPGLMGAMEHKRGSLWVLRGLSETEDPRCPDGKAQTLAQDAVGIAASLTAELARDEPVIALRRWRCVWAYAPEEQLPGAAARGTLVKLALERSRALEHEGKLELSLRHASFATILSAHDVTLRRETERLRTRLFAKRP